MAEPELTDETLDLLFDLSRSAPREQLDTAEALDRKVTQLLAAASVVIGIAGVSHQGAHKHVLWLALAGFLVVAVAAVAALPVRLFRVGINPPQLWSRYWADPPRRIKHAFVADIAAGYDDNRKRLMWKRWSVQAAVVGLALEVVAVAIAVLT